MDSKRRQYSTASIKLLADDMTAHLGRSTVDNVLNTLFQIDKQIHDDFNSVKQDLTLARKDADRTRDALRQEITLREQLQSRSENQHAHIQSLTAQVKRLEDALGKNVLVANQQTVDNLNKDRSTKQRFVDSVNVNLDQLLEKGCECRPASAPNSNDFLRGEHSDDCQLRKSLLVVGTHEGLTNLLIAREDAHRNHKVLVKRLKNDNSHLKQTYDNLWSRYQLLHTNRLSADTIPEDSLLEDKFQHLSVRVQQAGQLACDAASRVEERLHETTQSVDKFHQSISGTAQETANPFERCMLSQQLKSLPQNTAPGSEANHHQDNVIRDEYDADDTFDSADTFMVQSCSNSTESEKCFVAGEELLKTLRTQQEAHEKLRTTVVELTQELERISPEKISEARQYRQRMEAAEKELSKLRSQFSEKESTISDLKKQLNKVVAEYEAVSVMHSYSNAELSKIRANNREKAKLDRQPSDRQHALGNAVLDGVENLLHHRKLHFR